MVEELHNWIWFQGGPLDGTFCDIPEKCQDEGCNERAHVVTKDDVVYKPTGKLVWSPELEAVADIWTPEKKKWWSRR